MNNDRRKAISLLIKQAEENCTTFDQLTELLSKIKEEAQELASDIGNIRDEEQEYLDNIPESLQQSERYYAAEAAVEQLEAAIEKLEEVSEFELDFSLDDVITALDEAKA